MGNIENNTAKEVIKLIYDFKNNDSILWVENNGIQLLVSDDFKSLELKSLITRLKPEIVEFLKLNNIFSKQDFLNKRIFKTGLKECMLSFSQERLWFFEQYEEGTNAYHIADVYVLDENANKEGISYALQKVVSRHEVLRTTITLEEEGNQGIQRIHDAPLLIETVLLKDTDDVHAIIKNEISRPFDLTKEYPIRAVFYSISSANKPPKTLLLVNVHHIASDGWSTDLFEKDLFAYYEAYSHNNGSFDLPPLGIQYKDYVLWQKYFLTETVLKPQITYWKEKLSGYQNLEIPTDYPRPEKVSYTGNIHEFRISKEISGKLRELAQKTGVTLNSVMLSTINILLHKYSGQEDIVIGTVNANRHHRQTEELIGFFVNTQICRTILNASQTFEELIQQIHQERAEAQLHRDLPYERLIDELGVERDLSRHPVFQVMFGVQSFGNSIRNSSHKNYLKSYLIEDLYDAEKFDLSIFIDDGHEEFKGEIGFATSLFHKDTIVKLTNHYLHLLSMLVQKPQALYSEIGLLNDQEFKQIIFDWNATEKSYSKDKLLHTLFEEQVAKTPDRVALVFKDEQLTYRELNEKSNQLARVIKEQYKKKTKKELEPDTLIALFLDRSLEMAIGILSVLKAGAAYVPIDPQYPKERIEYILQDTKTELVLTLKQLSERHVDKLCQGKILNIDLTEKLYSKGGKSNLSQKNNSNSLAYIIYTSGTTGRPKGVMVEHFSAVNTIQALYHVYDVQEIKKVTAYTSYVFDVSVSELFTPLLQGIELHILDNSIRTDSAELAAYFKANDINLAYLPPVLLSQLPTSVYPALKTLIYAGEPCDKQTARSWSSNVKLFNYYGPTEACIYATGKQIITDEVEQIGLPIQNNKMYILDQRSIPVPVGVIGELYIAGAGIARGYLNRKDLTEERFISNPFATEADKKNGYTRLYKTGDLVRLLTDGTIEYIGRNDEQVKIRGYRIELGEIENALLQTEDVKQACVLVKQKKTEEGNNRYLVAYYVVENKNKTITAATISAKLSLVLPAYMIPDAFVLMETLPLTINGKLDKRALPDPDFNQESAAEHLPTTPLEKEVCDIWKKLLGLSQVGIASDFFKLGGNSILAIQVSHRMSKLLGGQVKVADIFKYKTIAQLLAHVSEQSQITIPKTESKQAILSFAQERLFFIEQYEEGTHIYNMPDLFQLHEDTSIEGVTYAIQKIVERHEVLRSTIEQEENLEHPIQKVKNAPLTIETIALNDTDDYEAMIKQEINKPFDLKREYPIRATFYRIRPVKDNSKIKTLLLLNIHHIASDGWSLEIVAKELYAFYESYQLKDKSFTLPALDIQYKDYAVWQRNYLTGAVLEKQLDYWKNKLQGFQHLEFPTDTARTGSIDYKGAYRKFKINKEISGKLRELAQRNGVSLNSVMLSSINILLHKYSGQEDIVIGTVNANRHYRQTEELIGFFVNTQANRTILNASQNFEELIRQVHEEQTEAQLHQDLPFEKLIDALGVERDPSRHPIFQIMFMFQSFGQEKGKHKEQKNYLKPYELSGEEEVAKFDLSVFIHDGQEELIVELNYATSLFQKDTISRLTKHYLNLLEALVQAPHERYTGISLIDTPEFEEIIFDWNATEKNYARDRSLHVLFEEQAAKTPDEVAVVFKDQQLTYKELHEKSNQLARVIKQQYKKKTKKELEPDTLIALFLDRSLEMVIGILATLKAGAAYVPIDPGYPKDRIDYLLLDTKAELILTQKQWAEKYNDEHIQDKIIPIDLTEKLYSKGDRSNLVHAITSNNLAYIIYTSGTTGRPKGVMVEHHSVINLIQDLLHQYNIEEKERFLLFSNYVFDASVEQLFLSLLSGGKLFVMDTETVLESKHFEEFILNNAITHVHATPSYLSSIDPSAFKQVKRVIFGAEYLSPDLFYRYKKYIPTVINEYGPTETTVTSLIAINTPVLAKPVIQNTKAYILDVNGNPVPYGVTGELHIGGAGVTRGYLNREELTKERFINNPFATEADKKSGYTRLYKTGDLARWLSDGTMEYIGRNDEQVKIRGYRIELGEIENVLTQVEGIKQACVIVREKKIEEGNKNRYLAAYYVLENKNSAWTPVAISTKLSEVLPTYMIPDAFVSLEILPLTINGKLDKRALPDPDFNQEQREESLPTTPQEKEVCTIWEKLLGLSQVGINTDFFKLGGNSILAIQVSHRMSKLLNCQVKVADVFRYKTIAQLLAHVSEQSQITIPKIASKQAVLSFAQERLFFIEQYEGGTHIYNIPELLQLSANTNMEALKYAIQKIVQRHEIVRSTINKVNSQDEYLQVVHDAPLAIEEVKLNDTDDYEAIIKQDIVKPFNLSKDYPVRIKFYTIESMQDNSISKRILLINNHHIANDGWSSEIFEKELYAYYTSYISKDVSFQLPALDIQYKDYAAWQRNYLTGETLEKQLSFWKNKLSGYQNLEFPTDYARTGEVDYKGDTELFAIDKELSQKLRALAQKNGVALNSVLLSTITILLHKYTGQEDIVTGGIIANRHHRQTEGLLGFFVNTQANRTILNKSQTFEELIHQVQSEQTEVQLHQDLPFEKLVDALGVERDLSRHPIFQIMFMVQSFGLDKHASPEQKEYLQTYELADPDDVARFDLAIYIDDSQEEFPGRIVYMKNLFHKNTIRRFINHYKHLLDQLVAEPNRPYVEFSLLTPQENKQIVYDWNESENKYQKDRSFIEIFEKQVLDKPNDVAVVFEGTSLTYQQLQDESNKLANYLISTFNPQPNEFIGIMLDRSEKTIISILAILKAGAAYACIDPEYPSERKKFMVEDTALNVLITQSDYLFDLEFYTGNLFAIDIQLGTLDTSPLSPEKLIKPEDLAYVIYTSGTTGKPKGVTVEHHQIVSFACENNFIDFNKTKVVGGMSNFAFDGSVFDLFFSLANGKKLILIDKQRLLDLSKLDEQFIEHKIDTVFITTAMFNTLVQNESACLKSLQQIQFGGERCSIEIINKFKDNYKDVSLIHVYGPTENIVFSTYCNLNDYDTTHVAPIGKHLSDKKLYVLNAAKIPVPIGVIGELYVGGAGVARGYLNREELTNERFVPNPFATDTDKTYGFNRMYKTGDLVRWLPDGHIEYIGRNDEQVKIRGHRIELSEIENVLLQMDGVKLACVVVRERKTDAVSSKYLVAYYIPENGSTITQTTLQEELAKVLPEYMIPSLLVEMQAFPLNSNGKLDKRALPDPEFNAAENYVAPVTPLEVQACAIWQEILGLDKVGITDNFFNIGGDSIISIRLASKMQQSGFNVSVREIFNRKTIQELLKHTSVSDVKKEKDYFPFSLISNELKHKILKENNIVPEHIQDLYPASYLQSGMLVETFSKGNTDAYHIVDSFDINSPFNKDHFKNTWQGLINRHELLRTAFVLSETGYMNVVYKSLDVNSKLSIKNQFRDHELIVAAEREQSLDMASAGLFRLVILQDDTNERFSLIFTQHHAIIDGWSLASIISEFTDAYLHHKDYNNILLPAYGKFIGQELEALGNSNYKKFWAEHLEDYELKSTNLRLHKATAPSTEQLSVYEELSPDLNDKILSLTKKLNVSPDVVFLGIYNLVLSMLYHTTDLVIGRTVNNRLEEEGGDKVFGVHLNTLPIRFKTEGIQHKSASEYLLQVFNDKLTINDYKLYPYAKIKADLNFQENIYQCSFNYVHFHIAEKHFNDESVIQQHGESSTSIPLTLNVIRTGVSFRLAVESFTHFMDADTARRLLNSMVLYLDQLTVHPDKLLKDYVLLTEKEQEQIVYQWNTTENPYSKDKLLQVLFEEQAAKTPDEAAIVFNNLQLTYRELNEKSNQLARVIRERFREKTKKELEPDTLIALFLDRSLEMVIGILAVLKAGAAYVPIDPGYPKERIDYLLLDTKAQLILTQKQCTEKHKEEIPQEKIIHIDLTETFYSKEDKSNLIHAAASHNLAYIIYTSGTTGRPKGVMVEHHSVINLIQDLLHKYSIENKEQFLLFSNYVFDASVEQLFLSLLSGGKLFIIDNETVLESTRLEDFVMNNAITHVHATPSYLSSIDASGFKHVKRVIFGAEYLSPDLFSRYKKYIPTVINEYGPTETTVTTLIAINSPVLTKPVIQNTKAYILDVNGNPVPYGVTGELHIGGAGVTRGYLNREELTKERFISNPFATEADKKNGYTRLYKTGDLARWLSDGTMEYIGRNDEQVKIRGYRIELGEIENVLTQVEGIQQACVIVRERKVEGINRKYILGYYVSDDKKLDSESIQKKLSAVLPEYMLPSAIIRLDAFPLTVNGKLNRRALPDMDTDSFASEYTAPSTQTEKEMCGIWKSLLGLDQVGITNDFFRIGGDSILAIQASHRMSKLLGSTVKVADVFRFKTIENILANLEKKFELVQAFQPKYNPAHADLIFIHPGAGGSEVYQGLSELVSTHYNCIGIDNYNIHHAEKISSLNQLANMYLAAFEEKYTFQKVIHIMGWSLGGSIALEMAAILESKGFENIHVILLDTFIQDEVMISFHDEEYIRKSRKAFEKGMLEANFDTAYRENLFAVIDAELKLTRTELSKHLTSTKVLLFKANQINWFNDVDDAAIKNNYILNLTSNNIDLKVDQLKVTWLNCNHDNILQAGKEVITNHLLSKYPDSKKMKLQNQD